MPNGLSDKPEIVVDVLKNILFPQFSHTKSVDGRVVLVRLLFL